MMEKDQFAFNLHLLQCVHENAKIIHTLTRKVDLEERPDLQKDIAEAQERFFNTFDACMKILEEAKK